MKNDNKTTTADCRRKLAASQRATSWEDGTIKERDERQKDPEIKEKKKQEEGSGKGGSKGAGYRISPKHLGRWHVKKKENDRWGSER